MRSAWVLLLLVPMASAAPGIDNAAGPVPATLYAHFDGRQDFLLNPQAPPTGVVSTESRGLVTHSLTCIPNNNLPTLVRNSHHTIYGYFQSGDMIYDGNDVRMSGFRGLVTDLLLDPDQEPRLRWVLEANPSPALDAVEGAEPPVVIPQVSLRATLREGDDISREHIAFDAGRLIAQGESQAATLTPFLSGHPEVSHHEVDGQHLYVFDFPLPYASTDELASDSFNLRIDVFIAVDQCDPDADYLMVDWVRFHSRDGYRPTLDLSVLDPLSVLEITPAIDGNDVRIEAVVSTPWGAQDLRDIRMSVAGEPVETQLLDRFGTHYDEAGNGVHCHCYEQRFPHVRADLTAEPGWHDVVLELGNLQGTANVTARVGFEIGSKTVTTCAVEGADVVCVEEASLAGQRDAPGLGLLLPLVFAALLRRKP